MAQRSALKREDDRDKRAISERVMAAASFLVTASLFAYLTWQAVTAPSGGVPEVRIEGVETTPEGDVLVHLRLASGAASGLKEAGLAVDCADPPISLVVTNVPAKGSRSATVRCPPGTQDPRVSLTHWIEA